MSGTPGSGRMYVVAFVNIEVGVHIPLMRPPDSTSHAWPRLLEGKYAFNIVAMNLLAGHGIDNSRLDTEEGKGRGARLGGRNAC